MVSQKAHALVLPFPAQGHINPMLQFSKRLVSKGIKTTFINTIYISKTMHANNLDHASINFETISDGFDDCGFYESADTSADEGCYVDILSKVGSKSLIDLIKKLEANGNPVNVLIYDSFLIWGLDVAKEFGLMCAAFSTQTCAVMNAYYHVFKGILSLPLSDSPVVLPGVPELQPSELPSFVFKYGSYPGFTDMVLKQFSNIDGADWFICNTFYELDEEL